MISLYDCFGKERKSDVNKLALKVGDLQKAKELALKWRSEGLVDYNEARGSLVLKLGVNVVPDKGSKKKKDEGGEE